MIELQHKTDGQGKVFSAEGAGLVPYTTSDTAPTGPNPALYLSACTQASALETRLKRMKHHVRTAGRLIAETMSRDGRQYRALFVTLTYRPGVEWSPRHITGFIMNVRNWANRNGFKVGYLWVAETQKRGAVHYHAVIWLPAKKGIPRPDKKGWWKHGFSNVQPVKRNAVGYLMKYVSKGLGNYPDLPKGARVCASGGLDELARGEFHYWRLPRYVRENIQVGDRCRRQAGGGWFSTVTGESWRSDFGVLAFAKCKRGLDCNGRPLRDDTVVVLDATFNRVNGGLSQWCSELTELVQVIQREQAYYDLRAPWVPTLSETHDF